MLIIKNHKGSFQVRAAAVMQRDDKILLLNEPLVGEYWFLPGGRAEMHESSGEALTRELDEEMNLKTNVRRLLWVIENFFTLRGASYHTLGFYYTVEVSDHHPLSQQEEYFTERNEDGIQKKFHFRWCSLSEIRSMDIRPPCLKGLLTEATRSTTVTHFIVREDDAQS